MGSAFFEERKPQALRAQDDAQCPSATNDCKLSVAIPNTGAAATVVLKEVSSDCCKSFGKIDADLESILEGGKIPTNLTDKDKEAIQGMCTNCADQTKNPNSVIQVALPLL